MNKSKAVGTSAETRVVNFAQANGFPDAERLALRGNQDIGDVRLGKGVHLEIKAGKQAEWPSEGQVLKWREEAANEARNAGPDVVCYLVTKRSRVGDPDRWVAHLSVEEYAHLTGVRPITGIAGYILTVQLGGLLNMLKEITL